MSLLEEVARESNSALIVITHDMGVAARASRAYELYDGVLHEVVDPSALAQRAEAGHSGDEAHRSGDEAGVEQAGDEVGVEQAGDEAGRPGTEPVVTAPPVPPARDEPESTPVPEPPTPHEEGNQ